MFRCTCGLELSSYESAEERVDKTTACIFPLVNAKHWNELTVHITVKEDYFVISSTHNNVQLTTINSLETKAAVIWYVEVFDSLRQYMFEKRKVQTLIAIILSQAIHMLGYNLKKVKTFPLEVHSRLSLIIILLFDDTQQIPLNNCQIFQEKTDNFPLPMWRHESQ